MEISSGWVGTIAAIVGLIGGALVKWIMGELKEQKDDILSDISAIKGTQKVLFEKHDQLMRDFQDYKLHVAENYVNREILKEQLLPINSALASLRDEVRDLKK